MNHIRIYPPGHPDGVLHHSGLAVLWHWEVLSEKDIVDCGNEEDPDDAFIAAMSCMTKKCNQ